MRKLLSVLLLLITATAFSQSRATIKGKVTDSVTHQPMELATIAVLNVKDSVASLISYTVSDKNGQFALHNLPAGIPIKILISFVTYQPVRKFLNLSKGETVDIGTIILKPNNLKEVTINAERPPIVMRKDTIEFDAEAFKVRPNAVVEDLLKKLPGVEVDNDGTIHANGKAISKILVDGREFFASDPRIASKNLDADMIDKVQIYDDREDDPDHLVEDANVKKIINLKFKKKLRKSVFGKVYGGVGTEGRYESGALLNMFRDTLQVSLLGLSNNLSNTGFAYNDLSQYAGANRGGDGLFRSGALSTGGSNGIQKTIADGVNINTDYGKKLKLNLSYYFSHITVDNNSINNRQQLIPDINQQPLYDTTFTTNTVNNRFRTEDKHTITALIRLQPNDATQIKYEPVFSYSNNRSGNASNATSFSNFVPQITSSINSDNNSGNTLQFDHQFTFNHQFKKQGESLNITNSLQINPSSNTDYNINAVTSYISSFQSYAQNRYTNNSNNNVGANLSVAYRYPVIKKLTLDAGLNGDYNKFVYKSSLFDFDPYTGSYDSFLTNLSSNLTRNQWTENISQGLTYNFAKRVTLVAKVTEELQQVNNQFGQGYADLNQNYFYLIPNVRLSILNVSLNYQQSVRQPNISDMIPYSVVFSPLYSVTGNPLLKPIKSNTFSTSVYINTLQSEIGLYINSSFTFLDNGVYRVRTLSASGAETTTPINTTGSYNFYFNANLSKRFKKTHDLQFNTSTGLNYSQYHNFFEINHTDGYQTTYGGSISQHFSANWKDIITLDPEFSINPSFTSYTGVDYNSLNNTSYSFNTPFNIFWPKRINIAGTYSYNYTPLVAPGFQKSINLLNLSIAREFLKKDRGEIKLACYDVLNQAVSANRSIYENIITDNQAQILKRYVLLTLQFKFNKAITK